MTNFKISNIIKTKAKLYVCNRQLIQAAMYKLRGCIQQWEIMKKNVNAPQYLWYYYNNGDKSTLKAARKGGPGGAIAPPGIFVDTNV